MGTPGSLKGTVDSFRGLEECGGGVNNLESGKAIKESIPINRNRYLTILKLSFDNFYTVM
jgi:hypothetical protein